MKFTVKRSEWLRGEMGGSFLKRKADGLKCCLGFLAEALGAEEAKINGFRIPSLYQGITWPDAIYDVNGSTPTCRLLMVTNDRNDISEENREAALVSQFNLLGIEMEIVD